MPLMQHLGRDLGVMKDLFEIDLDEGGEGEGGDMDAG